jgi:Spy/CpxP family protein refolding chaperone
MSRKILICVLAALWLAATASAELRQDRHRRHKWWQDERVRAELALTEQQTQEVEQIFQAALPRLRAGKQQLDQLEADLSRMIAERTSDEATVAQQIDRVEAARAELNKTRTFMLYRMHRVLSAEQNSKLRAMSDREGRDRKENRQ